MTTMVARRFTVGELVDVVEPNNQRVRVGEIKEINFEEGTCSIRFTVEGVLRHGIPLEQVRTSNVFMTVARHRQPQGGTAPSVMMPQQVSPQSNVYTPPPQETQNQPNQISPLEEIILESALSNSNRTKPEDFPLYQFLLCNNLKTPGWLRRNEHQFEHGQALNETKYLTEEEKKKIFKMKLALACHPLPTTNLIARAWGVDGSTIYRVSQKIGQRKKWIREPFVLTRGNPSSIPTGDEDMQLLPTRYTKKDKQ